MKSWFSIKAKADGSAEISIFDEIGAWGVTAKDFIASLKTFAGKAVTLSINSPGGSVFDALAMYNALRAHGSEITTKTMGIAASAASLIFMAGDKRIMPENTFLMIHNPLTGAYGNAAELRDIADVLDKIGASLVGTYVSRTGMSEDEVKAMLADETWLNAADATDKGFATEVVAEMKVAATFDIDRLPEAIKAVYKGDADPQAAIVTVTVEESETSPDGEQETTTTTVTTWSGDAASQEETGSDPATSNDPQATLADEITAYAATVGMSDYASVVALNPRVKTLADAQASFTLAREITALCGITGKKDMADSLIRKGVSMDEARAALSEALAADADALATTSVRASATSPSSPAGGDVWAKILPKRRA